MGTTESFKVKNLDQIKTPIELSAEILKELKGFVHSGEHVDAAVITIPASFDVIQSNATKEAGLLAGFKQVILLQEPIAASLAYANKRKEKELGNGQWLVYDLGGGTFDVALIKIKDGEMKVLDHEGDNFLGGADFDNLIVEKIIIPFLNDKYKFNNLENELKSSSGKRNSLYYKLIQKAEDAKIILSAKTSAEIELCDFSDDNDEEIDMSLEITRSEFENIIKDSVDKTIEMIKKILVRNSLKSSDIQFTLMVGGSTYSPYVRKRVEEILQISINCDIEPTTAIAIGASYYAGTKEKTFLQEKADINTTGISVRAYCPPASKFDEETLSVRIEGNIDGLFYRITREDKGFDSGLKKVTSRISEDIPLVKDSYNFFKFTVYDGHNNIIETGTELIGVAQGKVHISGQPIANDICIEIDSDLDFDLGETKLFAYFQKNTILPDKKMKIFTLNKSIIKDSFDKIILNVLEGPKYNLPASNQIIGYLEISGNKVSRDIVKGAEIEITLEMSESRDIKATVYIPMSDQQFTKVFCVSKRDVPIPKLKDEVLFLSKKLETEIAEAVEREDYETADELNQIKKKVDELVVNSNQLTDDDVTDKKFQFEDSKRKIAQDIDTATKDKRITLLRIKYNEDKDWCKKLVDENGNDHDRKIFSDIAAREITFLNSMTPVKITEAIEELINLGVSILWRTPSFLEFKFKTLIAKPQLFNDQEQAKILSEAGSIAITNKNYDRLREVNWGLIALLPKNPQQEASTGQIGFL